jgi:hypothetical protein
LSFAPNNMVSRPSEMKTGAADGWVRIRTYCSLVLVSPRRQLNKQHVTLQLGRSSQPELHRLMIHVCFSLWYLQRVSLQDLRKLTRIKTDFNVLFCRYDLPGEFCGFFEVASCT